jgi:hypothetical protein
MKRYRQTRDIANTLYDSRLVVHENYEKSALNIRRIKEANINDKINFDNKYQINLPNSSEVVWYWAYILIFLSIICWIVVIFSIWLIVMLVEFVLF